ncbi:MAG: leucyl/phenylalanyl-tRNA--protein transferase [Parvibaculaceae bacterium]|nr:leucyl/phenylalanyl-tRNA--protein transferase [Parvibaculaceae bacterium]
MSLFSAVEKLLPPKLAHFAMAMAYSLRPARWYDGVGLLKMVWEKITRKPEGIFQRTTENALEAPGGLVDIGNDLSPSHLVDAYGLGVFPFAHVGPSKWVSPPARALGYLNETRIEKNLRRLLRQKKYTVTFDQDFEGVMRACAAPRAGRVHLTWINERMIAAYKDLHREGHAHSVEVWNGDGELVGGLYGVASGGVFVTESQFNIARDASKVAYVTLNRHLAEWGFQANDGKYMTQHLANLGMREVFRNEYTRLLSRTQDLKTTGRWTVDNDLDVAGWKPENPTPL